MFQIKKYVKLCVRIIRNPSVPKLLSSIVFRDAVAKTTTELLLSLILTVQDMNHFLKLAFLYCNTNNHCSDAILVKNPGPLEGQYYTTHNCLNLPLAYIRSSWREANIISFIIIFKIKLLILQQRLKQISLPKPTTDELNGVWAAGVTPKIGVALM